VPTLRQLGYPGNLLGIWFAFFMPAGTPGATVNVFAGALEKVVRNPELAAQLQPVGIVQEWRDAMALSDEISNEYKALSELQAKTAQPVK
jgi:tripartite-type tricarboxylate transporter receptor subunit TctC